VIEVALAGLPGGHVKILTLRPAFLKVLLRSVTELTLRFARNNFAEMAVPQSAFAGFGWVVMSGGVSRWCFFCLQSFAVYEIQRFLANVPVKIDSARFPNGISIEPPTMHRVIGSVKRKV
jgi:hypothetical protein